MDNQPCPSCTRSMARDVRPMTLSHKGFSATFDMPGWYCAGCGESVHTGRDMQTSDRHLNLLKAQAEHILIPAEVRRIRRKLGLTQEAAGAMLGGGPNAFHKYESGSVLPSQAISNLLRVLEAQPEALSVLRAGVGADGTVATAERPIDRTTLGGRQHRVKSHSQR